MKIGVNVFSETAENNTQLLQLEDLGCPIRYCLSWSEPDRVENARHKFTGIPMLGVLCNPPIPTERPDKVSPPNNLDRWLDYVEQTVMSVPIITEFEVWNEEDSDSFWKPEDADKYGILLEETIRTIHWGKPNAKVYLGGIAKESSWARFTKAVLLNKRVAWTLDGVAIHSYSISAMRKRYDDLLKVWKGPIILSETGWAVSKYGEQGQAVQLQRDIEMLKTWPQLDSVYIYRLHGNAQEDLALVRKDKTTRPAYDTLKGILQHA